MNQDFSAIIEQLKTEHADNLAQMPLPMGAEDFLKKKILEQDTDTITFMLKLAWVFGAQAGQQAVAQAQLLENQPRQRRVEA
jgi:hypothetical protein